MHCRTCTSCGHVEEKKHTLSKTYGADAASHWRTCSDCMGRIGVELSDLAIITSDNPRTEEPAAIIADIVKGAETASGTYKIIENRVKAIEYAMDIGKKDDIIVLAGKGHETYQEICGVKHHLDEREVVAAYLEEMRK